MGPYSSTLFRMNHEPQIRSLKPQTTHNNHDNNITDNRKNRLNSTMRFGSPCWVFLSFFGGLFIFFWWCLYYLKIIRNLILYLIKKNIFYIIFLSWLAILKSSFGEQLRGATLRLWKQHWRTVALKTIALGNSCRKHLWETAFRKQLFGASLAAVRCSFEAEQLWTAALNEEHLWERALKRNFGE